MSDKKLSRRYFLQSAAVVTAGLAAAACAPKIVKETVVVEKEVEKLVKETVVVEKEVEKEVTRVVEKQVPAQAKIVLRYGKFAGSIWELDKVYAEKFMEENPNIKVEVEDVIYPDMFKKCLALAATGTMWDVFSGHNIWSPYLAWKGVMLQLDSYVETHGESIEFEDFFDAIIADARHMGTGGKLYWFPTLVHAGGNAVVGFNLDMLREAGVEVPCDPREGDWTTDDWEEIVRKVAKPGEIFGLQIAGELHPLYTQQFTRTWGKTENDRSASADSWLLSLDGKRQQLGDEWPRVKAGLEWYHGLKEEGYVPTASDRELLPGVDLFMAGKCLSSSSVVRAPVNWKAKIGDKFEAAYVPWPKGPDGHRGSCLSYNTVSVYSKTERVDEALSLVARLISKERAMYAATQAGMRCMGRREAWFSKEAWARPLDGGVIEFVAKWLDSGVDPFPQPWNLRFNEWQDTWSQHVTAYMNAKENWSELVSHSQPACQEVLDLPLP